MAGADVEIQRRWRRILRGAACERFALAFGRWLSSLGGLIVLGQAGAMVLGREPAGLVGPGWAAAGLLALVAALAAAPPRGAARRRLARTWDRGVGARGALLAATHLLDEGGGSPRLAPLVLSEAGALPAGPLHAERPPAVSLSTAGGWLCLSFLLLLLPPAASPRSPEEALRSAWNAVMDGLGRTSGEEERNEEEAPREGLDRRIVLELRTNKTVYLMGEEILVTARVKTRALLAEAQTLKLRLGVADGLPFPDQGLGEGFRPVDFPGPVVLAGEAGAEARVVLPIKGFLNAADIYRPGLYTLEARAVSLGPDGADLGAVVSNRVTIQVAWNREHNRYRQPSPVKNEQKKRAPRARKKPKRDSRGQKGRKTPAPGPPEREPQVKLKSHAVKPLLSDGPEVLKDVNVFERERGGDLPPRREKRPPAERDLPPTFIRRQVEMLRRYSFSPEERRLVRLYFGQLDRDG